MKYGNVLVIGNSGVGKSTLINAVLGKEMAMTSWGGTSGTTSSLEIYESDEIPFRIIDSIGFEPSFLKRRKAISEVQKWSKACAKKTGETPQINAIWFCVDGEAGKLFPDAIDNLEKAISVWETVPLVVVITRSYSELTRDANVKMVKDALSGRKALAKNLKAIIPVVAQTYYLTASSCAAPMGVTELIELTNKILPDGVKAAERDIASFNLKRKRALARGTVLAATTTGAAAGATPAPLVDAAILPPVLGAQVKMLAKIYEVDDSADAKKIIDTIVELGSAGVTIKAAISALKAVPGVNLGASVINAVVSGAISASIGGAAAFAFEKVYLGEKSLADEKWVKEIVEEHLSSDFLAKLESAVEDVIKNGEAGDSDKNTVKVILETFAGEKKSC